MRLIGLLFAIALGACASASGAASAQPAAGPPSWWADHVGFMTRDGGRWLTPNPDAGGEGQPESFGLEWRATGGGAAMSGRLFGVKDGREIAEYWTFREFWHPGEQRVILQQWGATGAYGAGVATRSDENSDQVEQTFWLPDGRSWRDGHRTEENGDEYVTHSFDIDAAGVWTPRRTFLWRRAPPG